MYPSIQCNIGSALGLNHRCYYVNIVVNVGECLTTASTGQTTCQQGHNVVFNSGMTWVQFQLTTSPNPNGAGLMKFVALTNTALTPAAGDTVTGVVGQCGEGSGNQLTSNGAGARNDAIITSTGATPQLLQIQAVFTATGTGFTARNTCLENESTIDANLQQLASANFGPDTLASGDTLTITWSLTFSF